MDTWMGAERKQMGGEGDHPKNSKFPMIAHRDGYMDGCGKETNNRGSQSER